MAHATLKALVSLLTGMDWYMTEFVGIGGCRYIGPDILARGWAAAEERAAARGYRLVGLWVKDYPL